MKSTATTVNDYLDSLPPDRRDVLVKVRELVLSHLPPGYLELMQSGAISYVVPMELSGPTYNGSPLAIVSLANQKNYLALYLMGLYSQPSLLGDFQEKYRQANKKLDLGKSCLRFKTWQELEVGALKSVLASLPPNAFIEIYHQSRSKAASVKN